MDKNGIKHLLITIGIGVIFIACVLLFFRLLPFLLIGAAILWIVFFIVRKIKNVRAFSNESEKDDNYSSSEESYNQDEEFDTSQAIDVDYKEINKK